MKYKDYIDLGFKREERNDNQQSNGVLPCVSGSASRHFLFAATFKLDTYETATQNFGHVRKADFPTITNLKDVVRSYHKMANNIVILSISEVKEDEFKRFFSEQD